MFSIVLGLIRKKSHDFIQKLENVSTEMVKLTIQDTVLDVTGDDAEISPSLKAAKYAMAASCLEWTDLFDYLTGTLLILLNNINDIHSTIKDAIESAKIDKECNLSVADLDNLMVSNRMMMKIFGKVGMFEFLVDKR